MQELPPLLKDFLFVFAVAGFVFPFCVFAAWSLFLFGRCRFPRFISTVSITIVLLPVVCPLGAVAWAALRYGYNLNETLDWVATVGDHPTHYASGYSDSAFNKITVGMTKKQVLAILGEPYGGPDDNEQSWWYSGPDNAEQNFHMRTVEFDSHGIVLGTVKIFCKSDDD